MKKALALVLALVLAFSCSLAMFASAEESTQTDTSVNLARGIKPTNLKGEELKGAVYGGQWPGNFTADLTDGVAADKYPAAKQQDWFAFYYNKKNDGQLNEGVNADHVGDKNIGTAVLDLGKPCTIDKVTINLFLGSKDGIVPPESVKVETSNDGTTYTELQTKTFTKPETTVDKVEKVDFAAATAVGGRYVRVSVVLGGVFAFLNEIEVWGTEGAPAPAPAPEPVAHEITVDGKFDEALWANASTVDTTIWQGAKPNESWPKIAASYKVLADDENIYVAVTVADKWNYKDTSYQTGATNFRIWMLGDGDYAGESNRTFFDVTLKEDGTLALWYNTAADIRKQDGTGKIEAKAVSTDATEDIAVEFAIKKSAINATKGFKMMVTYSSPAIVEGDKAPVYNALHITPKNDYVKDDKGEYVLNDKGAYTLPKDWNTNAVMYQEFVYADGVVTKPGEGGDTSTDTSSTEETSSTGDASTAPETSTSASTDTSSTGTNTPATGDAGVIALVVMAVVAAIGSAVVVKARR